ncbi:MAG: ATP-binding protein, partial [Actinomycetota bacterium]
AAADAVRLEAPDRLPVPEAGGRVVVVDAEKVAVVDAPMWLQRADLGALLPVPLGTAEAVADLLDLDLASERAAGQVTGTGTQSEVPEPVRWLLPGCPPRWREHETLTVDGVAVDWWVDGHGTTAVVHAVTLAGLARGLAQAAGRWDLRLPVEAVLLDPGAAAEVLAEQVMIGNRS